MISVKIPGRKTIKIANLVLDFNGTLATDGKLTAETKQLLKEISSKISLHILTADTFGNAQKELADIDCRLVILTSSGQDKQKENYVKTLGKNHVAAIGNGRNDVRMLRKASIGIAVIQKEGAAAGVWKAADIICTSISDALELMLNPLRIVATLRN